MGCRKFGKKVGIVSIPNSDTKFISAVYVKKDRKKWGKKKEENKLPFIYICGQEKWIQHGDELEITPWQNHTCFVVHNIPQTEIKSFGPVTLCHVWLECEIPDQPRIQLKNMEKGDQEKEKDECF